MSCCGNNKKYNCGGIKQNASCVFIDNDCFPDYSEYKDDDCVTVEEAICELYENQDFILQSIDTEKLDDGCIDYPTTEINGKDVITIIDVLNEHQKLLCENSNCNCDSTIDLSGLDLKCLSDDCNSGVKSLTQVLQLIIDEICALKSQI
jgi:hypothetical protein